MAFMSVMLLMIMIFMPVLAVGFAAWIGAWVYVVFALVVGLLLLFCWNRFSKSKIYKDALVAEGWQSTLVTVVKWAMLIFAIFYLVTGVLVLLGVGVISSMLTA